MNMHKKLLWGMSATLVLGLAWAPSSTVNAQAGGLTCDDIEFTSAVTDRFPNAKAACLGVVEKDGKPYAKFTAEIDRVSGSSVRARMLLPDGSKSKIVTFNPAADARVNIQGRSYRYRELSRGQELDIYLPPDRWAIATHTEEAGDFETAATVTTVPLTTVEPSSSAEMASLPQTASPLPLIGLLGSLFVAFGAGLTIIRRRR